MLGLKVGTEEIQFYFNGHAIHDPRLKLSSRPVWCKMLVPLFYEEIRRTKNQSARGAGSSRSLTDSLKRPLALWLIKAS